MNFKEAQENINRYENGYEPGFDGPTDKEYWSSKGYIAALAGEEMKAKDVEIADLKDMQSFYKAELEYRKEELTTLKDDLAGTRLFLDQIQTELQAERELAKTLAEVLELVMKDTGYNDSGFYEKADKALTQYRGGVKP